MRLLLNIRTDASGAAFLAGAVAGLVPTNDAGEELVAALLEVLDGRRVQAPPPAGAPRPDPATTAADVAAVHRELGGNVAATARALGVARSTVRAHLARAHGAANDNGGARRAG